MQFIWNQEIAITLFFQSLGSWLYAPMRALSFLGQEEFFFACMPLIYWCIDAAWGLRIGAMLLLTHGINSALKLLFHAPRPFWVATQVRAMSVETSFGLPSGHAQISASVWGLSAAYLRRGWMWALAGTLILLIGLSRIYLGMHFSSDVLAGWLVGLALVAVFTRLEQPLFRRLSEYRLSTLILLSLVFSVAMLILYFLAVISMQSFSIPAAWVQNAQAAGSPLQPLNPEGIFTAAGAWFGLASGVAWIWRRGGFDAGGSPGQRAVRYLVGITSLGLLYFALDRIFPDTGNLLSYGLRYLRYTAIGFWASGLAPWLFIRLGLAQGSQMVKERINLENRAAID
ncbi:MAG: phosphatase PAP2 family protein [Chloroflexi bacterium]|nr:phosphatase PAP2 family protein [Chloroflexota bacterium]